jgi:hypothetical protein
VNEPELDAEAAVLELLAKPWGDHGLGSGSHYPWQRLILKDPRFRCLSHSPRQVTHGMLALLEVPADTGEPGAASRSESHCPSWCRAQVLPILRP